MSTKLPNKLSDCIDVALADLAKVERSKKYIVNMAIWHLAVEEKCAVCLAGAVMAKTLDLPATEDRFDPVGFGKHNDFRLAALNYLRCGSPRLAFCLGLWRRLPKGVSAQFPVTAYEQDTKKFKRDMRKLRDHLREHGQ